LIFFEKPLAFIMLLGAAALMVLTMLPRLAARRSEIFTEATREE
jgi:hypothetical protein